MTLRELTSKKWSDLFKRSIKWEAKQNKKAVIVNLCVLSPISSVQRPPSTLIILCAGQLSSLNIQFKQNKNLIINKSREPKYQKHHLGPICSITYNISIRLFSIARRTNKPNAKKKYIYKKKKRKANPKWLQLGGGGNPLKKQHNLYLVTNLVSHYSKILYNFSS